MLAAARRPSFLALVAVAALAGGGGAACYRPPAAEVKPVDFATAEAFAPKVTAALVPCEAAKLDALIDLEQFSRLAMHDAGGPALGRKGFLEELNRKKLGINLCPTVGETRRYRFLRVRVRDGEPRLLYRMLLGDNVNYIEFRIGRTPDSKDVRIVDVFTYLTGEPLSQTMRAVFNTALDGQSVDDMKKSGELMKSIGAAMQSGDHAQARRLIDQLPSALRKSKQMMLQRTVASADAPGDEYERTIDAFTKAFPDDPSLEMISLDGYFLKHEYDKVLTTVDKLDKRTGGDPHLDVIRASVHMAAGDLDKASARAQAAVTAEPEEQPAWWLLLTVQLGQKDHAGAIATARELKKRFDMSLQEDKMQTIEQYAGLLKSPEWKAYQAELAGAEAE